MLGEGRGVSSHRVWHTVGLHTEPGTQWACTQGLAHSGSAYRAWHTVGTYLPGFGVRTKEPK